MTALQEAAAAAGTVIIDVPAGWAAIIVAVLALLGGIVGHRFSRMTRLERENRELWWVCKRLVHSLYTHGIEPDKSLVDFINGKDDP